jgi:hypothetical protein
LPDGVIDPTNDYANRWLHRVTFPDGDNDGVADEVDNCPTVFNPDQLNSDGEIRPNGLHLSGDDITFQNHDLPGDACDTDDDNDGLLDTTESAGCNGHVTNPTDPDPDRDGLIDGWECFYGTNPNDANSGSLNPSGSTADLDGDRLTDVWEARGYNCGASTTDCDDDGCHDMVETGSVDNNLVIGDTDRIAVARRALGIYPPHPDMDRVFDIDKNGVVGDPDRVWVGRAALLPDWLPKDCNPD